MTAQHTLPHLRRGAGKSDGSNGLCAMQVISWENGDTKITDTPACADPALTRIVQKVNDTICGHRDGDLLCPPCSIAVLELAHRTVGTGGTNDLERHRVWVRIAADQARQVLHLARNQEVAEAAIVAAERWADTPSEENAATAATVAAAERWVGAYAAAAAAYDAAAYAAYAAAADADDAAAYAVYDTARLQLAHNAVDLFEQLTGRTPQPATPGTTATHTAMTNIGGLPS